jgi:hypothetical protein
MLYNIVYLPFPCSPFFAGGRRSGGPKSPGRRSRQGFCQMLAAVRELLTDQPDAIQICPHSKLGVGLLDFSRGRRPLRQRLMVQGEGEDYVGAYLASVEGTVERPLM